MSTNTVDFLMSIRHMCSEMPLAAPETEPLVATSEMDRAHLRRLHSRLSELERHAIAEEWGDFDALLDSMNTVHWRGEALYARMVERLGYTMNVGYPVSRELVDLVAGILSAGATTGSTTGATPGSTAGATTNRGDHAPTGATPADADVDVAHADADVARALADAYESASRPVATALPDEPYAPRLSRRWTVGASAIAALALVCVAFVFGQRSVVSPSLPDGRAVTINRAVAVGDLTVILGYAEKSVQATAVHVFVVNPSDRPQPTDLTMHDGRAPAGHAPGTDDARMHLPNTVVPPRSTVHQVIDMPGDIDEQSVIVTESKRKRRPIRWEVNPR